MNHTPGPWAVSPTKHRTLIVSDMGFHVAAVEDISPADARLIAAAPDLLAALRGVVLCADMRGDAEPLDAYQTRAAMLPQQIARARAAIACATGVCS